MNLSVKTRRLGKTILELEEVSKSYDDLKLLHDYSYIFKKGERVGMIGPNGVGKTTFLEILTGTLQPDSGEVKVGVNTSFGYYKQQEPTYKPGQRVLEVVTDIAENIALANGSLVSASQFLNMFHFPPPRQQVLAEKLSGGEKRRLALLCVLIANPNFLVLDEPTNDLDLITLSALESFLEEFAGCLIIVSHDRFFMDRLCDHLFVFEGEGKIRDFPGNYSEYRKEVKEKEEKVKDSNKQKTGKKEKTASVRKLSFKEQRELEILTTDLEEAETRKTELEANLNGGTQDFDELASWGSELQDLIKKIDEMTERWLELEEINENS